MGRAKRESSDLIKFETENERESFLNLVSEAYSGEKSDMACFIMAYIALLSKYEFDIKTKKDYVLLKFGQGRKVKAYIQEPSFEKEDWLEFDLNFTIDPEDVSTSLIIERAKAVEIVLNITHPETGKGIRGMSVKTESAPRANNSTLYKNKFSILF